MLSAAAGGVLLDLASTGPVGPHALALLPAAYAAVLCASRIERPNPVFVTLGAAAATLLYSGLLVLVDAVLGASVPPTGAAFRLAVAAAVYNAALAQPVFALVRSTSLGRISRRAQA